MRSEENISERMQLHHTIHSLQNRINHLETLVFNMRSIIDNLSVSTNHLLIQQIKQYQCNCKGKLSC